MFKVNGKKLDVTFFNDQTSQVWKVPEDLFLMQTINIEWYFDYEGEVMHLIQMVDLFRSRGPRIINLYMDYLPYARQDKKISNETTFALYSFNKILNILELDKISILDPHSKVLDIKAEYIIPNDKINLAFKHSESDLKCYPDKGAWQRYGNCTDKEFELYKVRDQSTGQITKIEVPLHYVSIVQDKSVLIVDDICDRGSTFIEAAKLLYGAGAREVNLFVTHGLFSAGLGPLREAGIKRIFTKKGEAGSAGSYNVCYNPWEKL
jgi:ribose-phosphate pyrophosphokinase